MVRKYPESFRDVVDGLVIGTGIQSLASQLMFRSGNIKSVSKNPNTAKNHGQGCHILEKSWISFAVLESP